MKTLTIIITALLCPFTLLAQEAYTLNEKYDINLSGTLNLDTDDANVKITGSNRSDVHLKVYRKVTSKGIVFGDIDFEIVVENRNGNLYISENLDGSRVSVVGYHEEEYNIEIDVPFGVSLDIEGDDDDYVISDIKGGITLKVDDGDVQLRNCSGNKFDFTLDDGDITMDMGSGSLDVRLDDGDVEIKNASFSQINASVDDGDLIIETSLAKNGTYSFRADDSDIVFNVIGGGGAFDINHDDSRLYTSEGFQTLRKDDSRTELKLGDGSANVKMRVDDATIRLTSK